MSFETNRFKGVDPRRDQREALHSLPRGQISTTMILLIVFIVFVIAAVGWWFASRSTPALLAPLSTTVPSSSTAPPGAPAPAGITPAAAPGAMSVDQLYKEARQAMSENRMVAPPGNNALEYYLGILAKQPDDSGATDALRELFPFATGNVEDQINQGNFDEATRVMALLAKADPSNYSLTILRGKLDAKRKQSDRDQQLLAQKDAARAQAAATAAARVAAPVTSSAPPTAPATTATAPATAAPPPLVTPTAAPSPPQRTATVAAPPSATTASPAQSRAAKALVPPKPSYPTQAARNHQEGWVEVEFTVNVDGDVQNAHVIASNPSRLFDREALSAIEKTKYEPRLENGNAVASVLRRRIEFKLN